MDDMAPVFDALGSDTRRRILDIVKANPGCSVGEVAKEFDTTRVAVMHHLRQLEDCSLIVSEKEGRVRRLFHNPVPIQLIYDRWTTEYAGFWASRMADVKYAVEHPDAQPGARHGRNRQARFPNRDQGRHRGRVA